MADLVAIGYPDEATAEEAAAEARRLASDLIIEPGAIAVVSRDTAGMYHVHMRHHAVGAAATWGMFWGLLFGLLFFVPLAGMTMGSGLGVLMGKVTKSAVDERFQAHVREMLQPGTATLFLIVETVASDTAVAAMSRLGGTVLTTPMSGEGERVPQEALRGASPTAA